MRGELTRIERPARATVTLALVNGRGERSEFVFDERSTCLIGRGEDCSPRLPNDEHHRSVSRHHCMLDINPPDVRIRDFGSRNGTYVNGVKIGQRDPAQSAAQGRGLGLQERDLTIMSITTEPSCSIPMVTISRSSVTSRPDLENT